MPRNSTHLTEQHCKGNHYLKTFGYGDKQGQNPIFANGENLLFPQVENLVTILIVGNKDVGYSIIVQKHLDELNHSSLHTVTEMDFSIFLHF